MIGCVDATRQKRGASDGGGGAKGDERWKATMQTRPDIFELAVKNGPTWSGSIDRRRRNQYPILGKINWTT